MKLHTITKHIGAAALLLLILLVGGSIRLQGLPTLPTGQFASNDAYLYYSHAESVSLTSPSSAKPSRKASIHLI